MMVRCPFCGSEDTSCEKYDYDAWEHGCILTTEDFACVPCGRRFTVRATYPLEAYIAIDEGGEILKDRMAREAIVPQTPPFDDMLRWVAGNIVHAVSAGYGDGELPSKDEDGFREASAAECVTFIDATTALIDKNYGRIMDLAIGMMKKMRGR